MEKFLLLAFSEEFLSFLREWQFHLPFIAFATAVWIAIVIHLIKTGHATFGPNGNSDDIACGDTRVWRILVIFAGSAGLSFGLPYYWIMRSFHLTGWFSEYWTGFVYVQFATSVLQTVIFMLYAIFGPRKKWWRLFKAHLKGCGWVSALSPFGWILYLIQQFLPNPVKFLTWIPRDVETIFVFTYSLFYSPLVAICGTASLLGSISHLNINLFIPFIWWIDQDHKEDEDSSEK